MVIPLSQLPEDASNVPATYVMSIDKPTVVLKRFFGNSLSEICLDIKTFAIISGCFQ